MTGLAAILLLSFSELASHLGDTPDQVRERFGPPTEILQPLLSSSDVGSARSHEVDQPASWSATEPRRSALPSVSAGDQDFSAEGRRHIARRTITSRTTILHLNVRTN